MDFLEGKFGLGIKKLLQSGNIGDILWKLLLPFHYLGAETGYLILLPAG